MPPQRGPSGPHPITIIRYVLIFLVGIFSGMSISSWNAHMESTTVGGRHHDTGRSAHGCGPCPASPVCPVCPDCESSAPSVALATKESGPLKTTNCPPISSSGRARAVYSLPHVWCPHGQHGGGVDLTEKTLLKIPPGQLVIDVGAYDGSNAIMMAKAGHKVISMEPTPSKAAKIKKTLEDAARRGMSGSVKFFPWAASNFSGTAPFVVNVPVVMGRGGWQVDPRADAEDSKNLGSEQDSFAVPWKMDKSAYVDVKVEKLDNMVPEGETVLFMKVDAQGHDYRVLQGAERLLTEQRVLVLLAEFAPTLMVGGAPEALEMLEFIASKGYRCFGCGTTWPLGLEQGLPIDFGQWARHVKKQTFEHRGANHGQWDDIVCVADSARTVLKEYGL